MSFEYKEEYSWLTNICLNLTDACNLACKYCFVEQNPHYMTLDIAMKSVDFILTNLEKRKEQTGKNGKASITYFGGEPMLMWDEIIVPLTDYIRSNNLPISLNMTTNGTLLDKERIQYLKDNNIPILLSIDGAEETQCFNRPCQNSSLNSFELVTKNIPDILEAFPNTTFRGTIYAPTVEHTFENYIFAMKSGFKNIFLTPDVRHEWTTEEKQLLKQEIDKIYSFISFCFNNGIEPIDFSPVDTSFRRILGHDEYIAQEIEPDLFHPINRCGLGTSFGSIGYDGKIYGCQEQDSKGEDSFFYIGDINNGGIDKERHRALLEAYNQPIKRECINKKLCKNCPLTKICNDFGCPSSNYDLFGKFFTETEMQCLWDQMLFNNSTILMKELVEKDNQIFKQYLNSRCGYQKIFKQEDGDNNVM